MAELNLKVAASSDDCVRRLTPSYFSLTENGQLAGEYDTSNYKYGGGLRFLNVAIPKDSTITAAYLTLQSYYGSECGTVVNSRISAEKADNPATFSTLADFDARWANRTDARVDWDNIPAWIGDIDYTSPEIKTVIQEIISRAGWASGNALVIFWDDFDDRSTHGTYVYRDYYAYDASSTNCAKLHIEYTPPGGPAGRSLAYIIG
jgi:hypothetical protein